MGGFTEIGGRFRRRAIGWGTPEFPGQLIAVLVTFLSARFGLYLMINGVWWWVNLCLNFNLLFLKILVKVNFCFLGLEKVPQFDKKKVRIQIFKL